MHLMDAGRAADAGRGRRETLTPDHACFGLLCIGGYGNHRADSAGQEVDIVYLGTGLHDDEILRQAYRFQHASDVVELALGQ